MTNVDPLTLTTVPIQPFFDAVALPPATSFIYSRHGNLYLITNWHVVTARHAQTGTHLLEGGTRPNRLIAQFNVAQRHFEKNEIEFQLRDNNDNPLWLAHPAHSDQKRIDVVAIPFSSNSPSEKASGLFPVNDWANARLKILIGMDVFILGYPFGAKPPGYPVWKRGSIASEPDLVLLTGGYYLVDTASRPGMSGSPVILRSWTNHMVEPGVIAISDKPLNRFIGVYSGRLPSGSSEAQIGMVWHESYIDGIIDGNKYDT
jgi:hypothetical protein